MPPQDTTALIVPRRHWPCRRAAPPKPLRCSSSRLQPLHSPHRRCLDADSEHPEYPFHSLPRLLRPASCESPCDSTLSLRPFFLASRVRRSSAHPCTFFRIQEVPGLQRLNPSRPAQFGSPCFQ